MGRKCLECISRFYGIAKGLMIIRDMARQPEPDYEGIEVEAGIVEGEIKRLSEMGCVSSSVKEEIDEDLDALFRAIDAEDAAGVRAFAGDIERILTWEGLSDIAKMCQRERE